LLQNVYFVDYNIDPQEKIINKNLLPTSQQNW